MDLFLARRNLLLGPASQQREPKIGSPRTGVRNAEERSVPGFLFPSLLPLFSLSLFLFLPPLTQAPLPDLRLISSFRCSFAFSSLPLCSISPIEFGCHHWFSFFVVGKKHTAEEYHETPDANGWERVLTRKKITWSSNKINRPAGTS